MHRNLALFFARVGTIYFKMLGIVLKISYERVITLLPLRKGLLISNRSIQTALGHDGLQWTQNALCQDKLWGNTNIIETLWCLCTKDNIRAFDYCSLLLKKNDIWSVLFVIFKMCTS